MELEVQQLAAHQRWQELYKQCQQWKLADTHSWVQFWQ